MSYRLKVFFMPVIAVFLTLFLLTACEGGSSDSPKHEQASSDIPAQFSYEWLAGKTLYVVWWGGSGGDLPDNEDVNVVEKLIFSDDGQEVMVIGLLNSNANVSIPVSISPSGVLGSESEGNKIVCGSTNDYIKTHYLEGDDYNVDLFFFDEQKAMEFASTLSGSIPGCDSAPSENVGTISIADITLDGRIDDWSGIAPVRTDPMGDQIGSESADLLEYRVANNGQRMFFLIETAGNIDIEHTPTAEHSYYSAFTHLYSDSNCQDGHPAKFAGAGIYGGYGGQGEHHVGRGGPNEPKEFDIDYLAKYSYQNNYLEMSYSLHRVPKTVQSVRFNVITMVMNDSEALGDGYWNDQVGDSLSGCYEFPSLVDEAQLADDLVAIKLNETYEGIYFHRNDQITFELDVIQGKVYSISIEDELSGYDSRGNGAEVKVGIMMGHPEAIPFLTFGDDALTQKLDKTVNKVVFTAPSTGTAYLGTWSDNPNTTYFTLTVSEQ